MLVTLSLQFYQTFTIMTRGQQEWYLVPMRTVVRAGAHQNFKILGTGQIKISGTDWYRLRTKFKIMPTPDNAAHAVLIYSLDNDKFKVKDSHGVKYEIPIDRPDSVQVY